MNEFINHDLHPLVFLACGAVTLLVAAYMVIPAEAQTVPPTRASNEVTVGTSDALIRAVGDATIRRIIVAASMTDLPELSLKQGQSIRGEGNGITLTFREDLDGVRLVGDNRVENLSLRTSATRRAVYNDPSVDDLGAIELRHLVVVGRVQILARDRVRHGHVDVDHVDIVAADAHAEVERPQGYGVFVRQGAFTLWNMQPDAESVIIADLRNLSVGRPGRPVYGSGVFVSGTAGGGRLEVQRLETGAVYSDGRIASGTADQIAVGVGTLTGAFVDVVRNHGPVTTYGVNDMALDNWGVVERWVADEKVTTRGVSGIGFVNFGTLATLQLNAPIETFGGGARGFNVYDGTVSLAEFDRIVTHGDGAVGIQISRPIGRLTIRRGIETFGGVGPSLVKGVVRDLSAVALSIQPGGLVERLVIEGGLTRHAAGMVPLEQHGQITELCISGGFLGTEANEPRPLTR